MALYNHVGGRDDLEQAIVDELFCAPAPSDSTQPCRDRLHAAAAGLREIYLAHPNALPLVQTVPTTVHSSFGVVEHVLDALAEDGYTIEQGRLIWIGLVALVDGHVFYELQKHFTDPSDSEVLGPDLPRLCAAVAAGPVNYDAALGFALTAYTSGLPDPRGLAGEDRVGARKS